MQAIRSYVIRIYRSSRFGVAGVVEDVKTGKSRPFHSITELWDALRPRAQRERNDPRQTPDTPLD
jgi:hypothetical protein